MHNINIVNFKDIAIYRHEQYTVHIVVIIAQIAYIVAHIDFIVAYIAHIVAHILNFCLCYNYNIRITSVRTQ